MSNEEKGITLKPINLFSKNASIEKVKLGEELNSGIIIKSSDSMTASYELVMPPTRPADGSLLINDGDGSLSWIHIDTYIAPQSNSTLTLVDDPDNGLVIPGSKSYIADVAALAAEIQIAQSIKIDASPSFASLKLGSTNDVTLSFQGSTSYSLQFPSSQGAVNSIVGLSSPNTLEFTHAAELTLEADPLKGLSISASSWDGFANDTFYLSLDQSIHLDASPLYATFSIGSATDSVTMSPSASSFTSNSVILPVNPNNQLFETRVVTVSDVSDVSTALSIDKTITCTGIKLRNNTDSSYALLRGSVGSSSHTLSFMSNLATHSDSFLLNDGTGALSVTTFVVTNSSGSARNGLVPAPSAGEQHHYLAGDGTFKGAFTGCSSSTSGSTGLVPAPAIKYGSSNECYLRGDGSWGSTITGATSSTTSSLGLVPISVSSSGFLLGSAEFGSASSFTSAYASLIYSESSDVYEQTVSSSFSTTNWSIVALNKVVEFILNTGSANITLDLSDDEHHFKIQFAGLYKITAFINAANISSGETVSIGIFVNDVLEEESMSKSPILMNQGQVVTTSNGIAVMSEFIGTLEVNDSVVMKAKTSAVSAIILAPNFSIFKIY